MKEIIIRRNYFYLKNISMLQIVLYNKNSSIKSNFYHFNHYLLQLFIDIYANISNFFFNRT